MSKFDYKGFLKNNPLLKENYTKDTLLDKLGDADDALIQTFDGRELIIYNPNNDNLDNEDLYNDDTFFAVSKDGDEVELKYSDVTSIEAGNTPDVFNKEEENDYFDKRRAMSDYQNEDASEDEDPGSRAAIMNRLKNWDSESNDDEDEEDIEVGVEPTEEPESKPEPNRMSNADRLARGYKGKADIQKRAQSNKERRAKLAAAQQEKTSNIMLSNNFLINAFTGKIKHMYNDEQVYDSIDDAPPYFVNSLSDRDKHIVFQVTNKQLEEDLSGEEINALALVRLDSVGHYLDIDTAEVYPINADDTPDLKNAFSLHNEIDEEFINALSERDRLVVAKYTDQVM